MARFVPIAPMIPGIFGDVPDTALSRSDSGLDTWSICAPRWCDDGKGATVHFVPPVTGIHLAAITPPEHEVELFHDRDIASTRFPRFWAPARLSRLGVKRPEAAFRPPVWRSCGPSAPP